MSIFSIQNSFVGLFQKSWQWVDQTFDKAIDYIGQLAAKIPVHRDVANVYSDPSFALSVFSENLSKMLRYAKKENIGEHKRILFFRFFKRQMVRGLQGLSFLNPKEAAVLLWKNIFQMKDTQIKIKFLFELILPFVPKGPQYTHVLSNLLDNILELLKRGKFTEVAKSLAEMELVIPNQIYEAFLSKLKACLDPNLLPQLEEKIQKQKKIVQKEELACKIKDFHQEFRLTSLATKKSGYDWSQAFPITLLALSLIPGIGAQTLRQSFKEDLMIRPPALMDGDHFSVTKFLISKNICNDNSSFLCTLPSEISNFNCNWNLQKLAFSRLKGINCTFIAPAPKVCQLQGAKFEKSYFQKMVVENADFSFSESFATIFEEGKFQNVSFDHLKGGASFKKIYSTNSSWRNLEGDYYFSGSDLNEVHFQQDLLKYNTTGFSPIATNLTFTGAKVEKGNFTIIFPKKIYEPFSYPTNFTFSLIASPSEKGSVFNLCDFSPIGYHESCDATRGQYPFTVTQHFQLNDTLLSSSFLDDIKTDPECRDRELFYGGSFNNVSASKGFKFPIHRDIGCTYFTLYDVAACDYFHLTWPSYRCFTRNCNSVDVGFNETALRLEFDKALEERNAIYLTGKNFDMERYSWPNGFCDASFLQSCTPPDALFFGENKTYTNMFFPNIMLHATNKEIKNPRVVDSLAINSCLIFRNWTWENAEFIDTHIQFSSSNPVFLNSTFDKTLFWNAGGALVFEDCFLKHSRLGGDYPLIILMDSIRMKNTLIENSAIQAVANDFKIEKSKIVDTHMQTVFFNALYGQTVLFNVTFDKYPWRHGFPEQSVIFEESDLIDINVHQGEAFRNATFKNIKTLNLRMDSNDISSISFYGRFFNINQMISNFSHVDLRSPLFDSVTLSGLWKDYVLGTETVYFWEKPPVAKNLTVNSMIFDNMPACYQVQASKVKKCLQHLGFKFGKNITFINYAPENRSNSIFLVIGVVTGIFGFTLATGVLVYLLKRKNAEKRLVLQNYQEVN